MILKDNFGKVKLNGKVIGIVTNIKLEIGVYCTCEGPVQKVITSSDCPKCRGKNR